MKKIRIEDAVGSVLCHDITQIIPKKFKGVAFKKGHVIQAKDIPKLLSMGKAHIYVWEKQPGMVHENEAAQRLGALCKGENIEGSKITEGKMNMLAQCDGLLKIDRQRILSVNSIDEIMVAARHHNSIVRRGEKLAGTRVIPLVIKEEKVEQAEAICENQPLMWIQPFQQHKMGIITTGSEVYYGRIQDAFGPVIRQKAAEYNVEVIDQIIVDDDIQAIVEAIKTLESKGATLIVCTGGMSVDPDDRTPSAIKAYGADIVTYGAPILPGAMFLLAYKNDLPVLGLPGCVMYAKRTVFDLIFPRILCGEKVKKEDMHAYGHGGLCLDCETCHFPECGFGKGC